MTGKVLMNMSEKELKDMGFILDAQRKTLQTDIEEFSSPPPTAK